MDGAKKKLIYIHTPDINKPVANTKQVLYMCNEFRKFIKTTLITTGVSNDIEGTIKSKIGLDRHFDLIVKKTKLQILLLLLFKFSCHKYIYITRSVVILLALYLLNFKCITLEVHSVKLNTNKLLNLIYKKIICICKCRVNFIFISKNMMDYYITKLNVPLNRSIVLHDGINVDSYSSEVKPHNNRLIVYTGKIDKDRNIEQIIELAKLNKKLYFLIVGGEMNEILPFRKMIEEYKLKNIKIYRFQKKKRIDYLQSNAHVLLAFWSDKIPTMNYCSPLKIFEYIYNGNKILIHNFKIIKEIVKSENDNIKYCDRNNIDNIHSQLNKLIKSKLNLNQKLEMKKYIMAEYSYYDRAKKVLSHVAE